MVLFLDSNKKKYSTFLDIGSLNSRAVAKVKG